MRAALPETPLCIWPDTVPEAEVAIVWSPTQDFFDAHKHLRLIFNMGAGVDALMRLQLPAQAEVVRIEDGGMAVQMADYVCHALLRHFREFDRYEETAVRHNWIPRPPRSRVDFPVGVMGLGMLGRRVAQAVAGFDFPVLGWSQSPKQIDGVTCLAGPAAFSEFLSRTRVLVNLLPLTPSTRDLLDRPHLSQLRPNAYLINVARGEHVVEADLLDLIESGHVAGATLDVTRQEPLPADHPFWRSPQIVLTPHISAQTVFDEAIKQIVSKVAADRDGVPMTGVVDRRKGY